MPLIANLKSFVAINRERDRKTINNRGFSKSHTLCDKNIYPELKNRKHPNDHHLRSRPIVHTMSMSVLDRPI